MAADLFEAAVALVKADATCSALLTGGVHQDVAVEGTLTRGPFAVLVDVAWSPSFWTAGGGGVRASRTVDGTLQVSCYATTRAVARQCANAIASVLSDATPTITEGVVVYLRQTSARTERDPDLGPGGVSVFTDHRDYRYLVSTEI